MENTRAERARRRMRENYAKNRQRKLEYQREYNRRNKAAIAARRRARANCRRMTQRAWREQNADHVRAYQLQWREKNKKHVAEYARSRYDSEQKRAYNAAYYAANREERLAYRAAWSKSNPELAAHHATLRRARKARAEGSHSVEEWFDKCELFAWLCAYCGKDGPLARDHRLPLCRGGSDFISNIVPSCKSCNSAKGNKTDAEFLARQQHQNPAYL